jgi:predicted NBD/HSP70 family sugar kinase
MRTTIQNTAELRSFNMKRLIDYSRGHGAMTKKALSDALELSFATVSNICNQLLEDGILQETGIESSSGGRIPKLVSLSGMSRLTICLYLLRRDVYDISVADLSGREIRTEIVRTGGTLTMDELIGRFKSASDRMFADLGRDPHSAIGVAVAAPGIFNAETGCLINSTDPIFENRPLKAALENAFGLPVSIENESNLLVTAASRSLEAGKRSRDLVYLYIGDGVGVGIVSGGNLVTGSRGFGGEIEHLPIGSRNYECYCGNTGCVEPELIGSGFLRKWFEAGGGTQVLGTASGSGVESGAAVNGAASWDDFVAAVRRKRPDALAVVDENGRLIGKLLSVLVNIFDPEVLYVGGIIEGFFDAIRPSILSELDSRVVAKDRRSVPVVFDADYHAMVLKGCTELVFSAWHVQ